MLAGTDRRGVLYGLGRLLRLTRLTENGMSLPVMSIRAAPRLGVRSANGSFKTNMDPRTRQRTRARKWTKEEAITYFEEMLFQGASALTHGWGRSVPVALGRYDETTGKGVGVELARLAHDYGIHYFISNSINGIGSGNMRPEWRAALFGRRDPMLACPSIPAARQAILRSREIAFKHAPAIHSVKLGPADVAGCECEACRPWVATYYKLAEEIGHLLHKHHPRAELLIANQQFSAEDNEWIFGRIHKEQPRWLGGYCYAPGGSENSTYGFLKINEKWLRYPGRYPDFSFLKSRLFYMHPGHTVAALVDVSHWKRAQYGLKRIDPILSEVYHRRTFNTRPAAYKRILDGTLAYVNEAHAYSEGIFDDFNKFMLLRLAWDPDLSAHDVALEYYSYHCGERAGPILAEAAFIGEENYELPVLDNTHGIERFYQRVIDAGRSIPPVYRRDNWRYLMMVERATIDLYLLRKVQAAKPVYESVVAALRQACERGGLDQALAEAERRLRWPQETEEMKRLAREALRIDGELDRIVALRFHAILTMGEIDNVGLCWLRAQVQKAAAATDADERMAIVQSALHYDTVGEGEFYDNCGTLDGQPHFNPRSGQLYYGVIGRHRDSRPSQRSYNYSNEAQDGLEFNYAGLERSAEYEISLIYPNPKISFAMNSPNEFDVYANGVKIGRAVPTGEGFDRFAFRVPRAVTSSGNLSVQLRKVPGRARCTCVSEIWVRKATNARRAP